MLINCNEIQPPLCSFQSDEIVYDFTSEDVINSRKYSQLTENYSQCESRLGSLIKELSLYLTHKGEDPIL